MNLGLASIYLSLSAFAVSANAVPPLLSTISRDLLLPPWILGATITLQFSAFAGVSFFGEKLRSRLRLSLKAMVSVGLFVLGLALLAAPFALISLATILPWIFLLGCAGGLVETSSSLLLAGGHDEASSKPLCLSQAFYAIGAFAAPIAAQACLALIGGWKITFLVFGAFSTAIAFAFTASNRSAPNLGSISGIAASPASRVRAAEKDRRGYGLATLFAILIFVYVVGESFCGSWMPFMLEKLRGLQPREAASASSLLWLGMILGRLSILILPDNWGLSPALAACSILAAASTLLLSAGGPIFGLGLLGFFMGPIWPIAVKIASSTLRSESLTAAVIAAGGLGAAIGPLLGSVLVGGGLARSYFMVLSTLSLIVPGIVPVALASGKKGEA